MTLLQLPWQAMASIGGADFNSDNSVGLGDLVLFGAHWGTAKGDANWIVNFDLNGDEEVGLGDLVLLGDQWTGAAKMAKGALPLPTANVNLDMNYTFDNETSVYYVTVGVDQIEDLNGIKTPGRLRR